MRNYQATKETYISNNIKKKEKERYIEVILGRKAYYALNFEDSIRELAEAINIYYKTKGMA